MTFGEEMYLIYAKSLREQGSIVPPWELLPEIQRVAWMKVAEWVSETAL